MSIFSQGAIVLCIATFSILCNTIKANGYANDSDPLNPKQGLTQLWNPDFCQKYGGDCYQPATVWRCCFEDGVKYPHSSCRYVVGRGLICAPKSEKSKKSDPGRFEFTYEYFFKEHFFTYPGYVGGGFWRFDRDYESPYRWKDATRITYQEMKKLIPYVKRTADCPRGSSVLTVAKQSFSCQHLGREEILHLTGNNYKITIWSVRKGMILIMRSKYQTSRDTSLEKVAKKWRDKFMYHREY